MSDTSLELAQLLCTRLCHDLAGPVGAVAAGVELIGDDPAAADAETLGLIGHSSAAASRKLKFLRAALGTPGGAAADLKGLLEGYLAATAGPNGPPQVKWAEPGAINDGARAFGALWTPVVLNLFLLALDAVPGCRTLEFTCASQPAAAAVLARPGAGRTSALREELRAAVAGTDGVSTAKTIQAQFLGRMVRSAGGTVELKLAGETITVSASLIPKPIGTA